MKRWVRKESRRRGRRGVFEEENLREVCIKQGLEGGGRDGAMKKKESGRRNKRYSRGKEGRDERLWKKELESWAEREN